MTTETVAPLTFLRRGQPVTLRNVPPDRTRLAGLQRRQLRRAAPVSGPA